jgi:hypothetical protein
MGRRSYKPLKRKKYNGKQLRQSKKNVAKGREHEIPFLLKKQLGNIPNSVKKGLVDKILSYMPQKEVVDALTERDRLQHEVDEIERKPRQLYQLTRMARYRYPFAPEVSRGYEYTYPLVKLLNDETGQQETDLIDTIYSLKNAAEVQEYPYKFLQTLFANFLKFSKKRRKQDRYILSRIPDSELQQVLTTNKFFIIDFDFLIRHFNLNATDLMSRRRYIGTHRHKKQGRVGDIPIFIDPEGQTKKAKTYKSNSAYHSQLIQDIIFDHLISTYEAYWAIKHAVKIILNYLNNLRGRQPDWRNINFNTYNSISIPYQEIDVDGQRKPFREVWHNTIVGKYKYRLLRMEDGVGEDELPWDRVDPTMTNLGPFDVLLYYILQINKSLEYLAYYRITVVTTFIEAINHDLLIISRKMMELYNISERGIPVSYTWYDAHRERFSIVLPAFDDEPRANP